VTAFARYVLAGDNVIRGEEDVTGDYIINLTNKFDEHNYGVLGFWDADRRGLTWRRLKLLRTPSN